MAFGLSKLEGALDAGFKALIAKLDEILVEIKSLKETK